MRFIGNKANIVDTIYQILQSKNISGNSFFDFFSGTTSVARYFKKLDYKIYSSDLMYFSYVLQKAYIENNTVLTFDKLIKSLNIKNHNLFSNPLQMVIDFLNDIEPVEGFIYKNYTPDGSVDLKQPRMYFSNENGKKIDAIRTQIEIWKNSDLISDNEYYFLLAILIETVPFYANITGVYATFQKKWDIRATKKLQLRTIGFVINNNENQVFNVNSVGLIDKIECDIVYLDPPYNNRQYAPNYHILETIAKYDNPVIKGVGGLRNYEDQKSKFCNKNTALEELEKIINKANYKNLILSYNTEGIMEKNDILALFSKVGKVELVEFDYLLFKSNNNGDSKTKKIIQEQIYILKK